MDGKDAFSDERVGPHPFQQFVFGNDPAGVAGEGHEHIMSFGGERDSCAVVNKPAIRHVENEVTELDELTPARHGWADLSNLAYQLPDLVDLGRGSR